MELRLPTSYQTMSAAEQQEVVGGGVNLAMSRSYLNKSYCATSAHIYVTNCHWTHVTETQIKKEIYAHAYVYYNMGFLQNVPLASSIYASAANGIYIEDAVDSRQWAFELIWLL